MSKEDMTLHLTSDDIDAFIEAFEGSDWRELNLKYGASHIYISKDANSKGIQSSDNLNKEVEDPYREYQIKKKQQKTPSNEQEENEELQNNWVAINAPNLGTFYRSPKPDAPPFVEVGQQVEEETEVCLIEVMKLFTQVRAGVNGTVKKICVEDAQMVEYGQTLIYIEPSEQGE